MTTAIQKGNSQAPLIKYDNAVRSVTSNQSGIHDKLAEVVCKHLQHPFRKPIATHNLKAFELAQGWLDAQRKPVILDSFCGTGQSTRWLAEQHPECAVIGIDKSAARLSRHQPGDIDNYLLVQADADDLWRLALEAHWRPKKHCIFYPNPWPKSEHLKRRCHGSPLFSTLLALGGELELRTNWRIYAEEFCAALKIAKISATARKLEANQTVSLFEQKYSGAGQTLWQLQCTLPCPPLRQL